MTGYPLSLDAHLELALQLQTPLRLKDRQGHQLKRAPMLDELLRAARNVLFLLARHWGEMDSAGSSFGALRFSLGDYSAQPACYLEDWQRYSFRQREQLAVWRSQRPASVLWRYCASDSFASAGRTDPPRRKNHLRPWSLSTAVLTDCVNLDIKRFDCSASDTTRAEYSTELVG